MLCVLHMYDFIHMYDSHMCIMSVCVHILYIYTCVCMHVYHVYVYKYAFSCVHVYRVCKLHV